MKRGFFFKKFIMILFFVTAAILLFSFIVMSLWNGILPSVIHVNPITYPQAIGILVLSKILFSGFKGGPRGFGRHGRWQEGMREKWEKMSAEDREKFKQDMRRRCGGWRRNFDETRTATASAAPSGEANAE